MEVFYQNYSVADGYVKIRSIGIMEQQDQAAYFADKVNEKGKVINITETYINHLFRVTVWYEANKKVEK